MEDQVASLMKQLDAYESSLREMQRAAELGFKHITAARVAGKWAGRGGKEGAAAKARIDAALQALGKLQKVNSGHIKQTDTSWKQMATFIKMPPERKA